MARLASLMLCLMLALSAGLPLPAAAQGSSGTGFAIAPGLLVTNHHVVKGCANLSVVLPGSAQRAARLIADDPESDLALVYVLGLPGSIATLRATPVRLGEQVYAFGFPLAGALASSGNFTSGLVSALRGLRDREGELQFTAPVQPGNSGGALLDRSGLVIGVVQGKLDAIRAARVTGDIPQNVNFAISGDVLARFLEKHQAGVRPQGPRDAQETVAIAEAAQGFSFRITCAAAARTAAPQTPAAPPAPQPQAPAIPNEAAEAERALGLSVEAVRNVQLWLMALGHAPGSVDGVIGPATRRALRSFQRAVGAPETGLLSAPVLAALRQRGEPALARATPGGSLRDCPECPELVIVPRGSARLASGRDVTIAAPFAVGKFEVTFAEWDACVAQGGCSHRPDDRGWGRGRQPVMNVNWDDAQQYVTWLSRKTGKSYRLLSEAEWEYAAQAGTDREASVAEGAGQANCYGCGSRWDNKQTAPVGSFAANAFGLHDMIGNVWEWTADCWNESHAGTSTDGHARTSGDCARRALRGGSWYDIPRVARSANRVRGTTGDRFDSFGFRVARPL
jgi:formylglycine-generating enzyme required for sulfatase activity